MSGLFRRDKYIHVKGASEEEIRAGWQNELEAYKKMREKYLLYE